MSTKRTVYRESSLSRLRYMLPMVVGWILLARGRRLIYPLNAQIIPHTDAVDWFCAALCVAGLAFCCWARLTIRRNWSGTVTLKEDHELVVSGPYAIVRHPIYTGLLAMFLATAVALGYLAGILATLIVFLSFWIKLIEEEKLMANRFPEQYPAYKRRVKCIIPFVL